MIFRPESISVKIALRICGAVFIAMTLTGIVESVSRAQVTTAITSDGSLGTQVTQNGNNHDITGGTRPGDGPNLFHSFGQLSVGTTDIANFLNDSVLPTENILSRVTGGDPSNVFGTIQTTGFPDANLFLLNPAGVIFGPDATLNVSGSFYTSTADFLRLGDNGIFFANLAEESVLTMSPPEAFGFLNENPAGITVNRSSLKVSAEETLSLVGGDITIVGNPDQLPDETIPSLLAESGQVNLFSVASAGEVALTAPVNAHDSRFNSFESLGEIALSEGASVDTGGDGGGTVVIRSGQLIIDGSTIATSRTDPVEDSLNGLSKAEIDIQVVNDVVVDNESILELSVLADAAESPNPDRININADHLEIGKGSIIQSSVLPNSLEGHGGDVILKANSILLRDAESQVMTNAGGLASGGNIIVDVTRELTLTGSSLFQTLTSDQANKAGDIKIIADKFTINHEIFDGPPPFFLSGLFSFTDGKGNAGDIKIETNALQMNGGFISTVTVAEGQAGAIELLVDGDLSLIGNVNGGSIVANSFGEGNTGEVFIRANNLRLANDSHIQSSANAGNAATVDIRLQGTLDVREGSTIDTFTDGNGAAGDMIIMARDILIKGTPDQTNFVLGRTGLSVASNPGTGPGGDLTIMAENLQVTDQGSIRSETLGPGAGGDINVMVGELSLTNGATVTAESTSTEDGAANAGNINLKAKGTILIDNSIVTTQADNAAGGTISLTAGQNFTLSNGATVSASSSGPGNAGDIQLTAVDTILLDGATVTTEAEQASGGNIKLQAEELIQLVDSEITSRVRQGSENAGSINLDPDFIVIQNSEINTTAESGMGGNVTFRADLAILIDSFSKIDTSSRFGGSGIIDIQAPIKFLSGAIVPLENQPVNVAALYGARCVAGAAGHFSTFVDSKTDSLSPTPGTFLASPLLLPSAQIMADTSAGPPSPVMLTASLAPLVLGHAGAPMTACP